MITDLTKWQARLPKDKIQQSARIAASFEIQGMFLAQVPSDTEVRVKQCDDFLVIDTFWVNADGIFTERHSYRYHDDRYTEINFDLNKDDDLALATLCVKRLCASRVRQYSFIADLLGLNLSTVVKLAQS